MSADLSADAVGVLGLSRSDQLGGLFLGAASSFPKSIFLDNNEIPLDGQDKILTLFELTKSRYTIKSCNKILAIKTVVGMFFFY